MSYYDTSTYDYASAEGDNETVSTEEQQQSTSTELDSNSIQDKVDALKGAGKFNDLWKQNEFSAKVGLLLGLGGGIYALKTGKNILIYAAICGISGLAVANLVKKHIKVKNINTNIKIENDGKSE